MASVTNHRALHPHQIQCTGQLHEDQKRIQRNARPIDAFNYVSAVIPKGPVRLGSVDNLMHERSGSR